MKNHLSFAAAAALALAAQTGGAHALSIITSNDAAALAGTLFLNPQIGGSVGNLVIQDVAFSGEYGQAGTYMNASGTYGLPNAGIVLSTGNVADYADGANTSDSNTTGFSNPASEDQNALLQPITGQNNHNDVVELSIDFFAATPRDFVTFFATFGSEEYPEYVGESFNDGFGLYVNGVNVAGVLQTGANPGQDTPLPVNINHPDFAPLEGTELNGVLAPNGSPVLRFDVPIDPTATNNFTIILADATDDIFDTTVYLSSFFAEDGGVIDPDTPSLVGQNEFFPILPNNLPNEETGAFVLEIPDDIPAGETVWIDPPVAIGYEYEIDGDTEFASVSAPSLATVADLDGYFITVDGVSVAIAAGATLDFMAAFGVTPTEFTLTGIDPLLMLDPANTVAFPTGVSFTTVTGSITVTMTPIVEGDNVGAVPLPASALLYLGGVAAFGFAARRKRKAA